MMWIRMDEVTHRNIQTQQTHKHTHTHRAVYTSNQSKWSADPASTTNRPFFRFLAYMRKSDECSSAKAPPPQHSAKTKISKESISFGRRSRAHNSDAHKFHGEIVGKYFLWNKSRMNFVPWDFLELRRSHRLFANHFSFVYHNIGSMQKWN